MCDFCFQKNPPGPVRRSDTGWQAGKGDQLKDYKDPLVSHGWLRTGCWQWRWREVTVSDVRSEDTAAKHTG